MRLRRKPMYHGTASLDGQGRLTVQLRKRRRTFVEKVLDVVALPAMFLMGTFEFSRFGAQMALDQVFGRVQGPAARTMYLCLATSAPTDADSSAAVVAKEVFTAGTSGYARQAYGPTAPTAADPTVIQNTSTLTFGPFSSDPANVTHFFIFSALTGNSGDYVGWGAWTSPRDAANGDSLQVAAGALTISLT